jgi:hypothetical protein
MKIVHSKYHKGIGLYANPTSIEDFGLEGPANNKLTFPPAEKIDYVPTPARPATPVVGNAISERKGTRRSIGDLVATTGDIPWPLIGVAAVVGVVVLSSKKKMGVRGVGDINYTPLIILGALGIGAYALYQGIFGGTSPNTANNQAIAAQTQTAQASTLAQSTAKVVGTMSSSNLNSLATDIYNQGNTGNAADNQLASDAAQAQIVQDLAQMGNITDWYGLQTAFGTKSSCTVFSLGCQTFTLDSWIKAVCSPEVIAEINSNFAVAGIIYYL